MSNTAPHGSIDAEPNVVHIPEKQKATPKDGLSAFGLSTWA